MDKKDIKILSELEQNSRISINQLAKRVGVSKEVALYRVKRLTKERIIFEFYTKINTEALGFSRYGCFLQLKNINNEKETQFLNYLINNNFVTYLGPIIGKWNFVFDIFAKDRNQLEFIIKDITKKASKHIESLIIINSSAEHESFPLKILGISKETSISFIFVNSLSARCGVLL